MDDDALIDPLLESEGSGEGTGRDSTPSPSSSSSSGIGKTSAPPPSSPADPSATSSWRAYLRPWRRVEELPVSAPRPGCDWFSKLKCLAILAKENGRKDAQLDSVGVEKVIGTFGFSLFGSLSLYPSTVELVKDFKDTYKSVVLLSFGFIWVLVSVGVLCGLHGRSAFEQAVCRHTGRLGLLGLAALLMLHICCTLPGDTCTTILFWVLGAAAAGFHLMSWCASEEDKPEETAAAVQK